MMFYELLKKTREERGLLKKEVAAMFNWTPMYYGRYENGDVLPTNSNIQRFAEYIGISKVELQKIIDSSRRKL